jgi:hypothetical protein
MSSKSTIVGDVIRLPRIFFDRGSISMYALLHEIEYFSMSDLVTEDAIYQEFLEHPEYVNDWVDWSEAKRSSAGWYIRQRGDAGFEVGYFPPHYGSHKVAKYADVAQACAAFVKREIESIGEQHGTPHSEAPTLK